MSGSRDAVLGAIRAALARDPGAAEEARRPAAGEARPVPARSRRSAGERVALFAELAREVAATVERLPSPSRIPAAVARYLRSLNLPLELVAAPHPFLAGLPWDGEPLLAVRQGKAEERDRTGLAVAFAGIAETGTLMMASARESPNTLNLLPETHIVVVDERRIVGTYEEAFDLLGQRQGESGDARLPRTVLFVTGPSRSADIEQTLMLGAHGPKRLHILIVGEETGGTRGG